MGEQGREGWKFRFDILVALLLVLDVVIWVWVLYGFVRRHILVLGNTGSVVVVCN